MTTTYDVHQHLWPEELVAALRERRTSNTPGTCSSSTSFSSRVLLVTIDLAMGGTVIDIPEICYGREASGYNRSGIDKQDARRRTQGLYLLSVNHFPMQRNG